MRLRGSAQHLRRTLSEKPGPADRQTGHSIMQAAWWARGCTPAAASGLRPAGLGRRKLRSGPESLGWPSRVRRRAALLTPGKSWSSTRESTCSCARRHSSPREAWAKGGMWGWWRLSSALFFLSSAPRGACVLTETGTTLAVRALSPPPSADFADAERRRRGSAARELPARAPVKTLPGCRAARVAPHPPVSRWVRSRRCWRSRSALSRSQSRCCTKTRSTFGRLRHRRRRRPNTRRTPTRRRTTRTPSFAEHARTATWPRPRRC